MDSTIEIELSPATKKLFSEFLEVLQGINEKLSWLEVLEVSIRKPPTK